MDTGTGVVSRLARNVLIRNVKVLLRDRLEPVLPILVTCFTHDFLEFVCGDFVLCMYRMITNVSELEGLVTKTILLLL